MKKKSSMLVSFIMFLFVFFVSIPTDLQAAEKFEIKDGVLIKYNDQDNNNIKHVVIPDGVTSIEDLAFLDCINLISVTIPNSVTSIGEWAFNGCINLTSITIPNSVTSIGNYAFNGCTSLTSITIPNGVPNIGLEAFADCTNLTSITIPNSVTHIASNAFRDCIALTSITIPNSVTSFGDRVFENCTNLTSITILNTAIDIDYDTFQGVENLTIYSSSELDRYKFLKDNKNLKFLFLETPKLSPTTTLKATATAAKVLINSKNVEFDAYNISDNNFFKLRDLAMALNGTEKQFDVTYDDVAKVINLVSSKAYTVVGGELSKGDGNVKMPILTTAVTYKDGAEVSLTAYNIDGSNYFKLADIAKVFDFGLAWDGVTSTIRVDTSKKN